MDHRYTVQTTDTYSGQDTISGTDSNRQESLFTPSLYQAGTNSNDSYALSSFAPAQQQNETLTDASDDSSTSAESDTNSGSEFIEYFHSYSATGNFTQTSSSSDSAQQRQTSGWSLIEQGAFATGNFSLGC